LHPCLGPVLGNVPWTQLHVLALPVGAMLAKPGGGGLSLHGAPALDVPGPPLGGASLPWIGWDVGACVDPAVLGGLGVGVPTGSVVICLTASEAPGDGALAPSLVLVEAIFLPKVVRYECSWSHS
jgi:hypothetical protein